MSQDHFQEPSLLLPWVSELNLDHLSDFWNKRLCPLEAPPQCKILYFVVIVIYIAVIICYYMQQLRRTHKEFIAFSSSLTDIILQMSSYCLSERFNGTIKYTDKEPVVINEQSVQENQKHGYQACSS